MIIRYYFCITKFLLNKRNLPENENEVLFWALANAVHIWNQSGNPQGKTFSQHIHDDPDVNSLMGLLIHQKIFAIIALYFWPLIAIAVIWKHQSNKLQQWLQAIERPDLYLAYPCAKFSSQAIKERRSDILIGIFNFWHYYQTKCEEYEVDNKAIFEKRARQKNLSAIRSLSLAEAKKISPPYFVKDPQKDAGLGIHQCYSYIELMEYTKNKNVLIQPTITNHYDLLKILPTNPPLCTLRLTSILSDPDPVCVNAYFRIGAANNFIDNVCRGGVMVEVDLASGRLQEGISHLALKGLQPTEQIIRKIETASQEFFGLELPFFRQAIELTIRAHKALCPHLVALGWDVALTNDGPLLIEANTFPAAYETFHFNKSYSRINQLILKITHDVKINF